MLDPTQIISITYNDGHSLVLAQPQVHIQPLQPFPGILGWLPGPTPFIVTTTPAPGP
jgi:hypothetical protein